MCASFQRRPSAGGPTVAGYAALLAVLAGLVLVRLGVGYGTGTLRSATGLLRVPLLVTLAYSAVALAGLGAVYAAFTVGRDERLDGDELAQAALAAIPLVVVAVHVAFRRFDVGVSALPVARSGGYLVAVGGLAFGYARVADVDVATDPPTGDGWPATGLAVAVAALVTVVASLLGWPDAPFAAFRYGSRPSVPSLLLTTVVPVTVAAVGTALLFNGAVQPALRRSQSSAAAVGAVTLLAFGTDWTIAAVPIALSPLLGPIPAPARWLVVIVALLVAVACVSTVPFVYGRLRNRVGTFSHDQSPLVAAGSGAALCAVVAVAGFALVGSDPGPATVSYAVAVGVAALVHDRVRTVWAPALVYAAHGVVTQVVPYYVLSDAAGGVVVSALSALG